MLAWAGISAQPSYGLPARSTASKRADIRNPLSEAWGNTVAVCAIMRQEDPRDIEEFIKYHTYIGVSKFFLREHSDDKAVEATLRPYVERGIVDFGHLSGPKHPAQTDWYNACARMAAPSFDWLAFIDLDEFIVVLNKQNAVTERGALRKVLRRSFRFTAAVSLQWVLFGSSGHRQRPAEGQLGGFRRCTGVLSKQMKCLGNAFWLRAPDTFRPTHVHQCTFRDGGVAVLGNGEPLKMRRASGGGTSHVGHLPSQAHALYSHPSDEYQLALFHYVTRAQDDFIRRKITLRSGVYATEFAALSAASGGKGARPSQARIDEQYAAFEREHGFDGRDAMCEQGAAMADAVQRAERNGWSHLKPQ